MDAGAQLARAALLAPYLENRMPRKYLKRWSPNPEKLRNTRGLRLLGSWLLDPNLFHLNRHSVSLGALVGMVTAWLPLPGQMLLAGCAAVLLRCNLPVAALLTCLNNPFTFPLLLYVTYKVGSALLGGHAPPFEFEMSWEWLMNALPQYWRPLAAGSLTMGLLSGGLAMLAVRLYWRWYVGRRWRARQRARQARVS